MAANEWSPVGGSVGVTIQAVDMDRFSRLGFFDKAALGRYLPSLTAHLAHSVPLRTTAVRVDMHADGTFSRPTLDVTVVDAASRTITVVGPAVNHGAQSVVVPLPCAAGCRLIGLDLDRNVLDSSIMTGTWVVSSVDERAGASWSPVDAQLSAARAWRAGRRQTSGHDNVSASGTGLVDAFVAEPGGWPSVELADVPRPLPVLLTTDATVTTDTDPYVDDALGRQVPLSRVATVARLPRQLTSGGLADLTAARDGLPAFDRYGRWEVWLGADAPTDAFARLRAVGLVPGRPDTVAAHLQTLQQEGPALALRLFLFASFACSALALAAATLALAAAGRRRSFEMAALLAVGVRRVSLLRACVTEQILLLGTGLVLGVVPGLLAASIALPSVPEFADRSPVSLTYTASTSVVAGFVAILAGIVLGVAVVGGVALLRAAVPARLREATP
jgi:hypothetical protein